jgi:D-alanyl-D-alanine carboxypeptidase
MRAVIIIALSLIAAGCAGLPAMPSSYYRIDQVFRTAEAKGEFSGNVLVISRGAIVYKKSFGEANKARHERNRSSSRFLIASLSKPITAVAVLKLIEQGKLRLDDQLETIFPELKGAAVAGVTISQLLSHTSGIEEALAKHLARPLVPDDLKTASFSSKPGDFNYSSSGYVVLKLVMEKVTAQSYGQLMDVLIFQPSGMVHSGILRDSAPPTELSLAYQTSASAEPMARAAPLELFDGPGSIFSTTGDLALFDKALNDGRLLTPESQYLMASGPTPPVNWGYGWAKVEWGGKGALAHQGDFNGYHAVLVRQPATHNLIVILSNLDKTNVAALQKSVLGVLDKTP